MLAIDVVTDVQGFKTLREDWNTLAHYAGTVFQTWEWAWYWWNFNKKGKQLFIVVAYENSKIQGLAPLQISTSYLGLPIKVASFIGTNGTDYLSFLQMRKSLYIADELLNVILSKRDWDALDLHQLSSSDPVLDVALKKSHKSDLVVNKTEQDVCYRLKLPSSYDDLLAGLSKKFRWNVKYYKRRIARDYDVVFRLSDVGSVKQDMETFFYLHKKRLLGMKKPGAYLNPSFRQMHTSIASALCKAGCLRLYLMEIDDKPVAALYGFSFSGSFYYYLGGFDPDWGRMSVSTILIAYAIKQAIGEGLSSFDFLRGEEPYKEKWTATSSPNYRVLIHRSGKKSHVAKKMLSFENELTKKAKDIVKRIR